MNTVAVAAALAALVAVGCAASVDEAAEPAIATASGERAVNNEMTSSQPVVPASWPERLVVGVAPGPSARVAEAIQRTSRWLSDGIGVDIGISTLSGPEALADAVATGRVDVAVIDARAAERLDMDVLFQIVRDHRQYREMVWVVRAFDGCEDRRPLRTALFGAGDQGPDEAAEPAADEPWMICGELAGETTGVVEGLNTDGPGTPHELGIRAGRQHLEALGAVGVAAHPGSLTYAMTEAGLRMVASQQPTLRAYRTAGEALHALSSAEITAAVVDLAWIRQAELLPPGDVANDESFTVVAIGPAVPTELVVASSRLPESLKRVVAHAVEDMARSPQGSAAWLDLAGVEGFVEHDEASIAQALGFVRAAIADDRVASTP